jgi:transcriptional regulator with XRE-family HTH domain
VERAGLRLPGRNVRQRRRQLGFSQEELGQLATMTHDAVSELEHGSRNVNIVTALRICRALEVSPAELLADFSRSRLSRLR